MPIYHCFSSYLFITFHIYNSKKCNFLFFHIHKLQNRFYFVQWLFALIANTWHWTSEYIDHLKRNVFNQFNQFVYQHPTKHLLTDVFNIFHRFSFCRTDVKKLFEFWCEVSRTHGGIEQTNTLRHNGGGTLSSSSSAPMGVITESFPENFRDEKTIHDIPAFAFPCEFERWVLLLRFKLFHSHWYLFIQQRRRGIQVGTTHTT